MHDGIVHEVVQYGVADWGGRKEVKVQCSGLGQMGEEKQLMQE